MEFHTTFWKSEFIDFVILQQDSFDDVDAVSSIERQKNILDLVINICRTDLEFDNFNDVAAFFKELINVGRQMNYSEYESDNFNDYYSQLQKMISSKNVRCV